MTKIKLCGLSRPCDVEAANALKPDYIGFVFAPESRRHVTPRQAAELKGLLSPEIAAVGVFAGEAPETVAELLNGGVIDIAQLHGDETEDDIRRLRQLTDRPLIRAFRIRRAQDAAMAEASSADVVLLDSGAGTGRAFDWQLVQRIRRPYFLAGGLDPENVESAVKLLRPFAVDVSSGIETDGRKDRRKMAAFVAAVRRADADADAEQRFAVLP
jgi:phosphoribosylanthranilate isomerase